MKIAICISECVLGGVSQSSAMLALEFVRQGHATDILVTGKSGTENIGELRARGCNVIVLCENRIWLRKRLELVSQALREYDVLVNTHSLELQLLAPEISPEKVLINIVRNVVTGKKVLLNDRFFDAHVAISPGVAEHLMMMKASVPVHVIPNATEISADSLPLLDNPVQIAYLGRLEKWKNVKVLPEIFRRLRGRLDCRLTLIGNGPEEAELKTLFAEDVKSGLVCFAGACSRENLFSFLGKFNFLIVPSFFEGFGLVVAEAMACGVVPITSNLPSFTWIMGPDADSLQVADNDDAEQYVERILALTHDPMRYMDIQHRLRDRHRQRFIPAVTSSKYIKLFEYYGTGNRNTQRPVDHRQYLSQEMKWRCSFAYFLLQQINKVAVRLNFKKRRLDG